MPKAKKDRDTVAPSSDTPNVLLVLLNLGCAIALLVLSWKAAIRIDGFPDPELREYPRFRGPVVGTAVWSGFAIVLTIIILICYSNAACEHPRHPPSEMVGLAANAGVNVVMAGTLAALVAVQTSFLPRPWGRCQGAGMGQLRWVDLLAMPKGGGGRARYDVCMVFASIWRLEVALIVLLGLSSACNIYGAFRRRGSRARASARYLNRLTQRRQELAVLQTQHELREQRRQQWRQQIKQSQPSADSARSLEAILSQYELLATIAAHSHYHSIHSLLQVSRGIRATMLGCMPARSLWAKSLCGHLHPYNTEPPCFSCGTPTCPTCSTQEHLSDATIRHLRDCKPCCSACFRDRYCFMPLVPGVGTQLPSQCDWATVSHEKMVQDPDPTQVDGEGQRLYITVYASSVQPAQVHVCRDCSVYKTEAQIVGLGGVAGVGKTCARARVVEVDGGREAKVLREVGGVRCVRCHQGIGKGRSLWWVCEWCGRECVGGFHKNGAGLVAPECACGVGHWH